MISNTDEVVADSEDELSLLDLEPGNDTIEPASSTVFDKNAAMARQETQLSLPPIAVLPPPPSTIQIDSFTSPSILPAKQKAHGDITSDPIQSSSSAAAKSSRPKPRQPQRKRKSLAEQEIIEPTAGPSTISTFTPVSSKEIPIPDDIEGFSLGVAERAKLASRSRSAKTKQPVVPPADVIIIDSGDEYDDFLLASPPKKAKSKTAPKKTTKNPPPVTDRLPDSTPMFPIPLATSDPNISFDSQLPPSDLPPSSAPDLPKSPLFETISNPPENSPPSSPMPTARKRKRVAALAAALSDEEVIPIDKGTHTVDVQGDTSMQPPPPRFFVSSSDVSGTLPEPSAALSTKGKSPNKRKRQPKDDGTAVEGSPPKSKPKAKKKAANDDEEDWNGEDEPRKKRATKPKPKRQTKKTVVVEVPRVNSVSPKKSNLATEPLDKISSESRGKNKDGPAVVADSSSELSPLESEVDIPEPKQPSSTKKTASKAKDAPPTDKVPKSKGKSKHKAIVDSDEEDIERIPLSPKRNKGKQKQVPATAPDEVEEENHEPVHVSEPKQTTIPQTPTYSRPAPSSSSAARPYTNPHRAFSIPKKSTPMSELIKKVNSQPGSPFPTTARPVFIPLAKTSKSTLRKIAPLHLHRRTPPPPLPRPPPPKKTKKQLELEEKWEMELEDSVEGWYCMTEEERAGLRRAKRDAEMGFDD
ncbi:hypothetical protein QCA50_005861 [Cerrena zonata]|uniref:Uncharacterized protein n=1 Tax=Cerrena zonata TaxID=2478898 RepID=A0AAW0GLF5_9APHY